MRLENPQEYLALTLQSQKPLRKVNLSSTVSFKIVCIKVILTVLLPAQKKKRLTTENPVISHIIADNGIPFKHIQVRLR